MTDDTTDIFAQMETAAMLFSYIFKIEGRDGLLWLLNQSAASGWPQASLIKAADELTAMDLPLVAEAVAEAAANTPEPENPFPEHSANWRDWNRRVHGDFSGFYSEL